VPARGVSRSVDNCYARQTDTEEASLSVLGVGPTDIAKTTDQTTDSTSRESCAPGKMISFFQPFFGGTEGFVVNDWTVIAVCQSVVRGKSTGCTD